MLSVLERRCNHIDEAIRTQSEGPVAGHKSDTENLPATFVSATCFFVSQFIGTVAGRRKLSHWLGT